MTFDGRELRRIRRLLGFTQADLATALGLTVRNGAAAIADLEAGRRRLKFPPQILRLALERLAISRNVTMGELWPDRKHKASSGRKGLPRESKPEPPPPEPGTPIAIDPLAEVEDFEIEA